MIYLNQNDENEQIVYVFQVQKPLIRQNHVFLSKSKRFQNSYSHKLIPGPGSYNISTKKIQTLHKNNSIIQKESNIPKEYLWLLQNKRFGNQIMDKNKNLGPGLYNLQQQYVKSISFTKQKRFEFQKSQSNRLGPGSYCLPSTFNSQKRSKLNSLKTNKIIQKYNNYKKQKQIKNFSIKNPEQQHSNQQIISKIFNQISKISKKRKKMNIFQSKSQRFLIDKKQKIGPGYYQTCLLKKDSKQQKQNFSLALIQLKKKKKSKSKSPQQQRIKQITPIKYNSISNHYTIQRQIQKKGNYIGRRTRFNFRGGQKQTKFQPGPADYFINKFSFIDKQLYKKYNFDLKNPSNRKINQQDIFY